MVKIIRIIYLHAEISCAKIFFNGFRMAPDIFIKNTGGMPRANKAVKSSEDGVTRFLWGYTSFFLCGELFERL